MFENCRLDFQSVLRILNTLPKIEGHGGIALGCLGFDSEGKIGCLEPLLLHNGKYKRKNEIKEAIISANERGWIVSESFYDGIGSASNLVPSGDIYLDIPERIVELRQRTLSEARVHNYDVDANILEWKALGDEANYTYPEAYPLSKESAPVINAGETLDDCIISAETVENINQTNIKVWVSELPCLK